MSKKEVTLKKDVGLKDLPAGLQSVYDVQEIHEYGLDAEDFNIYLEGIPKECGSAADLEEPGVEYQMASRFIKNLHILSALDRKRPILIHMKTCGGFWEEGMAIYDAIKACPNPTTILSHTHARSISSIILQAARKRALMPHSYFLFHEGSLALAGTTKGVLTSAEWIKKVLNPTMLEIYTSSLKRKGKFSAWPANRIRVMLQRQMDKKEDVFLTAKQAVEWGFADEVFGADGKFDWASLRKFE